MEHHPRLRNCDVRFASVPMVTVVATKLVSLVTVGSLATVGCLVTVVVLATRVVLGIFILGNLRTLHIMTVSNLL